MKHLLWFLFVIAASVSCSVTQRMELDQSTEDVYPGYETGFESENCERILLENPDDMDCGVAKMRKNALAKMDVDDCIKRGGYIAGDGMFGLPSCQFDYSDGGKACRDNDECEGRCTLEYGLDPAQTSPTCTKNSRWAGCYSEVIKGDVQPAICYD